MRATVSASPTNPWLKSETELKFRYLSGGSNNECFW